MEAKLADLLKRSAWADRFHSEIHAQLVKLRDEPRPHAGLADHLDALVQKIHTRGDPWLPDVAGRAADLAHAQRRERLEEQATEMAEQHEKQQAEHTSEMARLGNEAESTKAKLVADYRAGESRLRGEYEARQRALQNEHDVVVASVKKQAQEAEASFRGRLQADHDRVVVELRQKAEQVEASLRSNLEAEREQWEAEAKQRAEDVLTAYKQELLTDHDREIARLRDRASQANALLDDKQRSLQAEHDRVVASLQEQAAGDKSSLAKEYQEKNISLRAEHDNEMAKVHKLQGEHAEKTQQLDRREKAWQEEHDRRDAEAAEERRRAEGELDSWHNTLRQREAEVESHANSLQEREDALQRDKDALRHEESALTQKHEGEAKLMAETRASRDREHDLRCSALQRERSELEDSKTQWRRHLDERLAQQQQKAVDTLDGVSSVVQGIEGGVQALETRLSAMVGGISDQVLSLDTSTTVTLESLTDLEQSCNGQAQRLDALRRDVASVAGTAQGVSKQLKTLEANLQKTSTSVSDVASSMGGQAHTLETLHQAVKGASATVHAAQEQVQNLGTSVQGVAVTVGAVYDKVDDSMRHLTAGLGGVETSVGALKAEFDGKTQALTHSVGELVREVGDVQLTIKTEFADIGEAHGATQESIRAVGAKVENSATALMGLETALGGSMKSIQDVAARVDTSVKSVGAGVKQTALTLGDIQTAQSSLRHDYGAGLEASVAAIGNLEAILGAWLTYLASRIRHGQEATKTYLKETSERTVAIRQDLEFAEERHAMRARDVVKHAQRAEASIQAVKAGTEAGSRALTELTSGFCTTKDSLNDLRDVAKHSASTSTTAWSTMVPVWKATAQTLAELNNRSAIVNHILEGLDGQSRASRDDFERVKESVKDIAARVGDVRDKIAEMDEKSGTAELTVTVEKLHQNTLTMVKALVEARQAVEKTGDEVRAGSKALSAIDSGVHTSIKGLSSKQDDLVAQLACREQNQTLKDERDAAKARNDVLTADNHRLTQELKAMREDGKLQAKITALEQDLRSKEERLLKLTEKHAGEKRGLEDPETPESKRRRGSDPGALAETPEWAAQVDDLVFLLQAMKARVEPGRVLRADMLMRETVWSLVQPQVSSHIREFLTRGHPQDQWLCWTSVLEGGDGVSCACGAGERCIEVKKEGSAHVFRADTLKQ